MDPRAEVVGQRVPPGPVRPGPVPQGPVPQGPVPQGLVPRVPPAVLRVDLWAAALQLVRTRVGRSIPARSRCRTRSHRWRPPPSCIPSARPELWPQKPTSPRAKFAVQSPLALALALAQDRAMAGLSWVTFHPCPEAIGVRCLNDVRCVNGTLRRADGRAASIRAKIFTRRHNPLG